MQRDILTPLGTIALTADQGAICALHWGASGALDDDPVLLQAQSELDRYFAGDPAPFAVPLAPRVSAFQQSFSDALCAIPYGETRTYGDLAADLGVSAQAIGQACGANPIAILIPCHRVLSATGLGGYSGAGGVETKVSLLRLEGAGSLLI